MRVRTTHLTNHLTTHLNSPNFILRGVVHILDGGIKHIGLRHEFRMQLCIIAPIKTPKEEKGNDEV